METMRDIKIRLKSIDSTRQITESMRMIANRKVQKIKARMQENRPYFEQSAKIINGVMNDAQAAFDLNEHEYIVGNKSEAKKPLLILITGDRGLCGGFNSNVIKEAALLAKKLGDAGFFAIGTKGRDYFKRRQRDIIQSFKGLSENPFFEDAQNIGQTAVKMYEEKTVDEVYLVYTEYYSMLKQVPKSVRLLPLDMDAVSEGVKPRAKPNAANTETENEGNIKINFEMSYDSGEEDFFEQAVSTYISSAVFGAMLESAVCEQCARMTGMDSAVKNSKKIIDSLTLQYNQMRQSAITQEIAEIVGGANAVGKEG